MSHYSLDSIPRLTQVDGRFYVTIEVSPPIISPTALGIIPPPLGTTLAAMPTADTSTSYPTSFAMNDPSPALMPTTIPVQDSLAAGSPFTSAQRPFLSDLVHNLTDESVGAFSLTESRVLSNGELSPPFCDSLEWLFAPSPESTPSREMESPFPAAQGASSPLQSATSCSDLTLPLLPYIEMAEPNPTTTIHNVVDKGITALNL